MTSPIAPARPWRRLRAMSLRAKPRSVMAASTRAAVSARTPGSWLTTRETVFRLTPAVLATSRMVGRTIAVLSLRGDGADNVVSGSPRRAYSVSDNVVNQPDSRVSGAFRSGPAPGRDALRTTHRGSDARHRWRRG